MEQNNLLEVINKLLIVQERDVRMMRCQREIDQIPARGKEIEGEANHLREAALAIKEEHKKLLTEIRKVELEVETIRQNIAKLREQQFQLKSNEEFKALNSEISHMTGEIKKFEDQAIILMEQGEEIQKKEIKARSELTAFEMTIKERLSALDSRKSNLEAEVRQLTSERANITKDIANEHMRVYNRIIENKKDQALVLVENSTCAGCHMHLPAQVICDIKKWSSLVTCSFCGRILYLIAGSLK